MAILFHTNVSRRIIHTKGVELTKRWGEKVYRRLTQINMSCDHYSVFLEAELQPKPIFYRQFREFCPPKFHPHY